MDGLNKLKYYGMALLLLSLFVIVGMSLILLWQYLILDYVFNPFILSGDMLFCFLLPLVICSLCTFKCCFDILSKFGKLRLKK